MLEDFDVFGSVRHLLQQVADPRSEPGLARHEDVRGVSWVAFLELLHRNGSFAPLEAFRAPGLRRVSQEEGVREVLAGLLSALQVLQAVQAVAVRLLQTVHLDEEHESARVHLLRGRHELAAVEALVRAGVAHVQLAAVASEGGRVHQLEDQVCVEQQTLAFADDEAGLVSEELEAQAWSSAGYPSRTGLPR